MKHQQLIQGLAKCVGCDIEEVERISSDKQASSKLRQFMKTGKKARFVCIDKGVEDPIFLFWRLLEANVLAPISHIIFVDIKDNVPGWKDLEIYESIKFGSIFLLTCDSTTKPPVMPSQRGIFREKE